MDMNTMLYEKLSRLQWLLHRQQMKAHAAVGPMADTSRGQGRILAFLKMKDGVSTKDLSYLLGIKVSSLNELLVKLEKAEYITRRPSETDKRVMLIYLTQKGKEEEEPAQQDTGSMFDHFSEEEQITFGNYLDRAIAALEAELGTEEQRDDMVDWMQSAKERMGPEQFEKWMKMSERMHGAWGPHGKGHCNGAFRKMPFGAHRFGAHGFDHGGHMHRGPGSQEYNHPDKPDNGEDN